MSMKIEEENEKLKEQVKLLELDVEKLEFDLDILKELFYQYCKFCEHWEYQGLGTGRCANCPEFDAENNRIENTGSDKFGELTQAMDSCVAWQILSSLEGKVDQLRELGKIVTLPGQRCSQKDCTSLVDDKRKKEKYTLHVILEVTDSKGITRNERLSFHCAICLYKWLWKDSEKNFHTALERLGWPDTEKEKTNHAK